MWRYLCASALLVSCVAPGTAGSEGALVNGAPSSDASVLAVIHTRPDGSRQLCTGTLVAARVVLTAKHCVYEDVGGTTWSAIPASDLSVSLGDSVAGSTGEIAVSTITTSAGPYHDGDGAIGGDLALLTLASEPVGLTPRALALRAPSVGEPLRIVGFGYTGAGATGTLGERNEGSAAVVSVDTGTFTSEGASWTCTGDSGGPALRAADGAVIGVTSIGPRGCPASTSIYTRLDLNADVLAAAGVPIAPGDDAGGIAADDAGSSAADAATTVARAPAGCACRAASSRGTPIPLALLLLGAGLVLGGRQSRAIARRTRSEKSPCSWAARKRSPRRRASAWRPSPASASTRSASRSSPNEP